MPVHRHLEVGKPGPRERGQLVGGGGAAGSGHDERDRDLAEALVGRADHRRVRHPGVVQQRFLDLTRVDVLPTADDDVPDASVDPQDPGRVHGAQVTGVQPALGVERPAGGLGIVVVAAHVQRRADPQLTVLAQVRGGPLGARPDDPHLAPR